MRLILEADEDNLHIAVRAGKSLHAAGYKECVYFYSRNDGVGEEVVIYARRNKASISSRQIEPKMKDGKETQDQSSKASRS